MAKSVYDLWQWWRARLADARRSEAKALAIVHRSFKRVPPGPTAAEHRALVMAQSQTFRTQTRFMVFVKRNRH